MKLGKLVYALVSCLLCVAQNVDTFSNCQKKANTQRDLQVCADQELTRVDAAMRHNYQELLAKANGDAIAEKK